jgi:hypothetical protein
MTTLAVAVIALFFALLAVADLLPAAAGRGAGPTAPGR